MSSPENTPLSPVELYEKLPLAQQKCLDEINFLASELREHLLPEQFILAVNAMTQRLQKMHPSIPCQSGCFRCCKNGLTPTLTPIEWEWVREALSELSEEIKAQIKHQLNATSTGASNSCPLLIAGRCSIYSSRPLDCRLHGYSFREQSPFTCQEEQLRMTQELKQQINPLGYMFMPQKDRLKTSFAKLTSQKSEPKSLIDYLITTFLCPP